MARRVGAPTLLTKQPSETSLDPEEEDKDDPELDSESETTGATGGSPRTAELARRVKEAKAAELSLLELAYKYVVGGLFGTLTLGYGFCTVVPAGHTVAMFRCGKFVSCTRARHTVRARP
jgi:hypothetical protein